jgi:hypothetical protein
LTGLSKELFKTFCAVKILIDEYNDFLDPQNFYQRDEHENINISKLKDYLYWKAD